MRFWLLAAIGIVVGLACSACDPPPDTISVPDSSRDPEEVLSEYTTARGLPAVSVLVALNGAVEYRRTMGVRRTGNPAKATESDAFHIGSDTKSMTAILAGMLVDEGKLSWTSTIASVLSGHVAYRSEYAEVTLEQLLAHTAGLPDVLPRAQWCSFLGKDTSQTEAERIRMAAATLALPPVSAPGAAFLYSNFGYVVAGCMIEQAAGISWEDLLRRRVFVPLGMTDAGFGPPASPGTVDAPWGHRPDPVDPADPAADNPAALGPAGTVHATPDDMVDYARLYISGGLDKDGGRILSASALDAIMTPRLESYALGWVSNGTPGNRVVLHDGSNTMFYCSIVIAPASGTIVLVMTNRGDTIGRNRGFELREYLWRRFASPTASYGNRVLDRL